MSMETKSKKHIFNEKLILGVINFSQINFNEATRRAILPWVVTNDILTKQDIMNNTSTRNKSPLNLTNYMFQRKANFLKLDSKKFITPSILFANVRGKNLEFLI